MNYRKKYKDYFKIHFGSEYDIHHIDFNHENNDIDNLLLLPKKLHRKLHDAKNIHACIVENDNNIFADIVNQVTCSIMAKSLLEVSNIYYELQQWVCMKEC